MTLADLPIGTPARVTAIETHAGSASANVHQAGNDVIHRLMEMGLVRGTEVRVEKVAPLGDPMELSVRGYLLSIRKKEASRFTVELVNR